MKSRFKGLLNSGKKKAADLYGQYGPQAHKALQDAAENARDKAEEAIAAGKTLYDENRETIQDTVDGLEASGKDFVDSIRGATISKEAIRERAHDVHIQSLLLKRQTSHWRRKSSVDRDTLIDCLFVGGIPLAGILAGSHQISDEVDAAFQLAFPVLSESTTFAEHAANLDPAALTGFISAVKGKLFEIRYVEHLNNGVLEEGYTALIAESPTQAGWDIAVTGPDGDVAQVIQAKATDSVYYVQQALEKYPHIDVVTTDEVYSSLMAEGVAAGVTQSGISDADLSDSVVTAAGEEALDSTPGLIPAAISLSLIAYTAYKKADLDAYQRANMVGERTASAALSLVTGYGLASVTGLILLAPVGSILTRGVIGTKQQRFRAYQSLTQRYDNLKKANKRLSGMLRATS